MARGRWNFRRPLHRVPVRRSKDASDLFFADEASLLVVEVDPQTGPFRRARTFDNLFAAGHKPKGERTQPMTVDWQALQRLRQAAAVFIFKPRKVPSFGWSTVDEGHLALVVPTFGLPG